MELAGIVFVVNGGSHRNSSEGVPFCSDMLSDIGTTWRRLFNFARVPQTRAKTFRRNPAAAKVHLASLESQQRRVVGGGKLRFAYRSKAGHGQPETESRRFALWCEVDGLEEERRGGGGFTSVGFGGLEVASSSLVLVRLAASLVVVIQ